MPSVQDFIDAENAVIGELVKRGDRQRAKSIELLPADLCEAVIANARREGERITAWRAKCQAELDIQRAALKGAEASVREKYVHIADRGQIIGDVLRGTTKVVFRPSAASVRTKAAIDLEAAQVKPVRAQIRWLERQIYACDSDLSKLRHIVKRAEVGSVSLLTYMTVGWQARLLVGEAHIGRLPPQVRALLPVQGQPVDAAGHELPPESMAEDGRTPDLPPSMRSSATTAGGEPGEFPPVPVHLPPAMQRRNEEIARRRAAGESMPVRPRRGSGGD